MARNPAEDPWRFRLDLDMAVMSWYYFDGDNRARASRHQKERQHRWDELERLELQKMKEEDAEALRKKQEGDNKEKKQKQTEAVEPDSKVAKTSSLRRLARMQNWPE